jgi:hypothetical protein
MLAYVDYSPCGFLIEGGKKSQNMFIQCRSQDKEKASANGSGMAKVESGNSIGRSAAIIQHCRSY